MTSLEKYIKDEGPLLSGELIEMLIGGTKPISNEAARQRLYRLNGDVFKIKGLFADKQVLFHHKDNYGSEDYYSGLSKAFKMAGKQYHIILQSLDFHYGQLKLNQLPSYSINPTLDLKGHVTFQTALQNLLRLNIIKVDEEYVSLSGLISDNNPNKLRSKGIEVAKNFLLIQFNDWSRKIGLVAYNSSKFYSTFGNYQFNFVSPSYVGSLPVRKSSKIVPGFVVADILIGNVINESQIEFHINKVRTLKYRKNIANFIPYLIVDSIDTQALNALKAEGIVVGFVEELFGENYKELLNSLINLVTNAGAILKKNPEAYLNLIIKLNKLVDGKTNNLRGDLFELAVGYYQGRICSSIEIGKLIIHDGLRREIDVYGTTTNKVIISECKGYNHKIEKTDIETWLGEKIPVIRKWVLDQPSISDKQIVVQFWATGGFEDDALELLRERKKKTTKYEIEFYGLDEMITKSQEVKSKKFEEILREYYKKEI